MIKAASEWETEEKRSRSRFIHDLPLDPLDVIEANLKSLGKHE